MLPVPEEDIQSAKGRSSESFDAQTDHSVRTNLRQKLKSIWKSSLLVNIKNRGSLMFSVIPQDMLLRTYYETKTSSDLLNWMFGNEQFQKMKLNQTMFHLSILLLQGTHWKSSSIDLDARIGLDINKECMAKHKLYDGVLEATIIALLVRQMSELILYVLQLKKYINWRRQVTCGGTSYTINMLILLFALNIFGFGLPTIMFL